VVTALSAVTTEAPQWRHRQRGRIRGSQNRPLSRHDDSDALFALEVHYFLRRIYPRHEDLPEGRAAADGSLTITISQAEPTDTVARANWLPAPEGQFALIVRAYVPTQPVLNGSYKLPNVERE
jgi:hypothetical protein